jgi:hypothetical protein
MEWGYLDTGITFEVTKLQNTQIAQTLYISWDNQSENISFIPSQTGFYALRREGNLGFNFVFGSYDEYVKVLQAGVTYEISGYGEGTLHIYYLGDLGFTFIQAESVSVLGDENTGMFEYVYAYISFSQEGDYEMAVENCQTIYNWHAFDLNDKGTPNYDNDTIGYSCNASFHVPYAGVYQFRFQSFNGGAVTVSLSIILP